MTILEWMTTLELSVGIYIYTCHVGPCETFPDNRDISTGVVIMRVLLR